MLSALINTGVIVLLAGYLVYEGIRRIMSKPHIFNVIYSYIHIQPLVSPLPVRPLLVTLLWLLHSFLYHPLDHCRKRLRVDNPGPTTFMSIHGHGSLSATSQYVNRECNQIAAASSRKSLDRFSVAGRQTNNLYVCPFSTRHKSHESYACPCSTGWVNGNAAPIDGKLMMIIACVGVVFNIVSGTLIYPLTLY